MQSLLSKAEQKGQARGTRPAEIAADGIQGVGRETEELRGEGGGDELEAQRCHGGAEQAEPLQRRHTEKVGGATWKFLTFLSIGRGKLDSQIRQACSMRHAVSISRDLQVDEQGEGGLDLTLPRALLTSSDTSCLSSTWS